MLASSLIEMEIHMVVKKTPETPHITENNMKSTTN